MHKFEFTNKELENIKNKIMFTELQERIIEYRMKEYSLVKMAELERYSSSKISKEIDKIVKKIKKVI